MPLMNSSHYLTSSNFYAQLRLDNFNVIQSTHSHQRINWKYKKQLETIYTMLKYDGSDAWIVTFVCFSWETELIGIDSMEQRSRKNEDKRCQRSDIDCRLKQSLSLRKCFQRKLMFHVASFSLLVEYFYNNEIIGRISEVKLFQLDA